MNLRTVGYSLAGLSFALGAAELLAGRRIAGRLGVGNRSGVVRAFGLREIGTGAALLARPTASTNVWARVAGDLIDLGTLGAAFRARGANRSALRGGIAFVTAALLADVAAGVAMQRQVRPA